MGGTKKGRAGGARPPAKNKTSATSNGKSTAARAANKPPAKASSRAAASAGARNVGTAKPTRGAAAEGLVKVSLAARARAEALLALIARRMQTIAEGFYDVGVALRELLEKKLFGALGYATFADMLKGRAVLGLTQAHKLIRLASAMSREQALAVGQEKAIALVDYARATPELDTPATLLATGTVANGKPAADASVRELRAATTKARKRAAPRPATPEQKSAARTAKSLQTWLRKRGAKTASVTTLTRSGVHFLHIEIPAAAAPALMS